MASITTVVKVSITRGSQQVPQEAFNVPTVFGPSNRFSGTLIKYYSDVLDMVADGFMLSDPEYISVAAIFEQTNPPPQVGVSKYTPAVAQVDTIAVGTLVATGHAYSFLMGSTQITYTSNSDTQQSILTALLAAINTAFPTNPPVTGVVSGSGSGALLTLTATVLGVGVSYSNFDTDLTHVTLTANHSIVNDIQATQAQDDSWYGLLCTSQADADILQIAEYVETQQKIYVTTSGEAGILTSSTSDIASQLKVKNLTRTSMLYSATPATQPDAAWMGRCLPVLPGAGNWKFRNLAGITADNLSTTQINNATGKRCNVYTEIGGVDVTTPGICFSGDYNDVIIFIDYLVSTMEVNVYQVLVSSEKVPFTNAGITAIENPVRQTLQTAEAQGGLAPGWTVTVPDISTISGADKASRTLNGITFNATLAGAIDIVNIQGFVGV